MYFSASRTDKVVNYDLDRDEILLEGQSGFQSPEQLAIVNAIRDQNANNIYFVQDLSVNVGIAYSGLGLAFIQNERYGNSGENIAAHEIGHLGGLGHPEDGFCVEPTEDVTTRLMSISHTHLNNCRLNKCEWDILNP